MSQPPPQKVRSRPNSAFSSCRIHPGARDLDGIDGVEARLDQVREQFADAAAAMEHDLDVGQVPSPDSKAAGGGA